jgi:choloylglycine hydrolase
VLCKNLDWDFDYGMIEVNKKGLFKRAFVTGNETPAEWTSKYGSITFNHVGKEFPLGGMNEAGLVVEEANYFWTKYPAPDNRPTLNELQWVQYQLDNFSTVQEVINSDSILRITGHLFKIHYLVCDGKGIAATIEFLDGRLVWHTDSTLETAVLTNHSYDQSIEALKDYKGFGGKKDIPQKYESLNNFIITSWLIRNYSLNKSLIDYSFSILSTVSRDDTQWSVVYDISNSSIYFKTKKNPQRRWIDLKHFNFSCDSSPLSLDINTGAIGNVDKKFISYTSEGNARLVSKIYAAFKGSGSLRKQFDSVYFKTIAGYAETTKCINH